jgi:hypothetical protein
MLVTSRKASFIKIPYALLGERLVHISEVTSGLSHECVCPECKAALIARKGQKVRHHFAHYHSTNCQPETVVHRIAKRLLAERIEAALAGRQDLQIRWKCAHCDDVHSGNLLRRVRSIYVERNFDSCRPDITLCEISDKPIALIEVVVTHPPDENVRNLCRNHSIEFLECHIRTEDDLEQITKSAPLQITCGTYCPRMRCSKCKARLPSNRLHVVVVKCNRCKHDMNVAYASCDRLVRGPDEFTPEEITAAEKHGVVLQLVTSKTLGAQYVANVCPRCKAFVGNHFMLDYMDWKADAVCWGICSGRNASLAAESSCDKSQLRMFDEA